MNKPGICIWCLFLILVLPLKPLAGGTSVTYAVPVWKNFTNEDSTGAYYDLLRRIFGAKGLELKILNVPLKRAMALVATSEADLVGGIEPTGHEDKFVLSKYPIYTDKVSALFKTQRIKTWKGIDTIREDVKMSAGPSQIKEMLGQELPIAELNYRDQCIQMLLADRIHYYVELDFVLRNVFKHVIEHKDGSTFDPENKVLKQKNMNINPDDFTIQTIKTTNLFMAFSNTQKGRDLEKIFTTGFEGLAKSGELERIYGKWDALAVMPDTHAIH